MTSKITEIASIVAIKCKLCDTIITFDVNDTSSFLSKTEHKDFFGMMLVTYRIQHSVDGEKHLNAVLVDQQNLFRGYIDAYKIPLLQEEEQFDFLDLNNYILLEEEIETLKPNNVFTNFFIVNLSGWILEVVKIGSLKLDAILKSIFDKINESKKIYNVLPQPLNVVIANLECFIWIEGKTFLIVTTHETNIIEKYAKLMEQITQNIENSGIIPKKRIFKILNTIFLETDLAENRPDFVLRLLNDDLFYSKIQIKYPERITEIVPKIAKRNSISKDILYELLLGKISLIELLDEKPELINQCRIIIETLDFIDRRKLLI